MRPPRCGASEAKGRNKPHQPRSRGLRITSKKPTVHNETPQEKAKREGTHKRVRELRERSGKLGDFEYTGELLEWLKTRGVAIRGKPYLTEEEIMLGQSESRADLRKFDLALRRAVTDLHNDLVAGRIVGRIV